VPFDTGDTSPGLTLLLLVGLDLLLCLTAILKGRWLMALVGAFVFPVSLVMSCRLAAPGSPWARRLYKPGSKKLARSEARFARARARHRRLLDAIGGKPSGPIATSIAAGGDDGAER
jgi:hypothetical protein